jgi:CHAT domain-containing protein
VVSPDGPLHLLPFAALAASVAPPRYLVELKPLHTVLSATLFAELRAVRRARPATDPKLLVGFGDPALTSAQPSGARPVTWAVTRSRALLPLPASRDEVQRIAALFGSAATTYVGPDASEERARALGLAPRYVHFAVHGLLNSRLPLDSALALSSPPTGATGRENGLLQAWEIFESVRLDADLVTLSACETGLGPDAGGEGLISLSRAFQYAGARTVLASLWAVSDRSTTDLMARFYAGLAQGLPKDEALQAAQIQSIHDPSATHPFHWAAFQLNGDWK